MVNTAHGNQHSNNMNYQKIYDSFIESKKKEPSQGAHHNHHIIPRHEDSSSVECVKLTVREHAFAHRLRFKITKTIGNYLAWKALSGIIGREEIVHFQASIGGKAGGRKTKESGVGIFSESWDRSLESKIRWESGTLKRSMFDHLRESGHYRNAGLSSVKSKRGIHSEEYDRSKANRLQWENMSKESRDARCQINKENSRLGGARSKELGTNFSSWDKEKRRKVCSKGGLAASKLPYWTNGVLTVRQILCPDGWVSGRAPRTERGRIKFNLRMQKGKNV